jgi:hypothetical protein
MGRKKNNLIFLICFWPMVLTSEAQQLKDSTMVNGTIEKPVYQVNRLEGENFD